MEVFVDLQNQEDLDTLMLKILNRPRSLVLESQRRTLCLLYENTKFVLNGFRSPYNHCSPIVNLNELKEIILLISLGVPPETAIHDVTTRTYGDQ